MVLAMPQTDAQVGLPPAENGFDLDIEVVENGPTVSDLFQLTNDNCGTTCASACPASCK